MSRESVRKWLLLAQGYVVICDLPTQPTRPSLDVDDTVSTAEFVIENLSAEDVVISGLDSSCSCVSALNVPLTLRPRTTGRLILAVDAICDPGRTRTFTNLLFVSTPCPRPQLVIEFACPPGSRPAVDTVAVPKPDPMFSP